MIKKNKLKIKLIKYYIYTQMPTKQDTDTKSPKIKNYNLRNKKNKKNRKQLKKKLNEESDSDSSSDYDPNKDEVEDMNPRELQKFIQKIFPSKSGKERLKQLEKIDEMLEKQEKKMKNKKIIKNNFNTSNSKEDDVSSEDLPSIEDATESDEDIPLLEMDDEYFPDDDMMDPVMQDMLNNNMKFNIIFTVGEPNPDEFADVEYYDTEESISNEDSNNESESDSECEVSKNTKKEKKRASKKIDDITEEEWNRMLLEQEKEMRENGTYYTTKFKKGESVLYKKKGWKDFLKCKIIKVNHNKVRSKVTYDLKLPKNYTEPRIFKNISSRKLKKIDSDENVLDELKTLMELKKNKGNKAMQKKFEQLCKEQEKKDMKKKKEKEKKQKGKNFRKLRKMLSERNQANSYKYFQNMSLDAQEKILTKLKAVNDFSKVEKPYKIQLLEADIPVEFKANALKKINTLDYMDPGSGEYYKIKHWVDAFMRIPFGKHQNLPITIDDGPEKCQEFMENAKKTLDQAVYGLEDAKMQILQMVGQWISNPNSLGTAIAIKGPPGTGKTTLVKEGVSKILNRPFAFLALGGATDSSYLEGHSYTYEGSVWGKIVDIILNCKCMNPVIYFDELDKISDTPKGEEIVGILTHLTDTTQNDKFHDKYFSNIDFDLSKAMFIFSYNDENKVNPILKDRMYRIKTDGYNVIQKGVIANNYLIPKIQLNVNFKQNEIIIPNDTLSYICSNLTNNEKGVRNLKRCLEIIHTKLNLYRLMKKGSTLFDKNEIINVEFPFTVTRNIVDKLIKQAKESSILSSMYI